MPHYYIQIPVSIFFCSIGKWDYSSKSYVLVNCFEQCLLNDEHNFHSQYQLLIILNHFSWYFDKIIHNHFWPLSHFAFLQGRHMRTKYIFHVLNIFNRDWEIMNDVLPYHHLQISKSCNSYNVVRLYFR